MFLILASGVSDYEFIIKAKDDFYHFKQSFDEND